MENEKILKKEEDLKRLAVVIPGTKTSNPMSKPNKQYLSKDSLMNTLSFSPAKIQTTKPKFHKKEKTVMPELDLHNYIDTVISGDKALINFIPDSKLPIFDSYDTPVTKKGVSTLYGYNYSKENAAVAHIHKSKTTGVHYINYPKNEQFESKYAYAIIKKWCPTEFKKLREAEQTRYKRIYAAELAIDIRYQRSKNERKIKCLKAWEKIKTYVLKRELLINKLITMFRKMKQYALSETVEELINELTRNLLMFYEIMDFEPLYATTQDIADVRLLIKGLTYESKIVF